MARQGLLLHQSEGVYVPTLSPNYTHAFRRDGFVLRLEQSHPDFEPAFAPLWRRSAEYTETSPERMYGLYQAVKHVARNDIPGDIVECGVWRGGSAMLAALTLLEVGDRQRRLCLYDTFSGMSEPTPRDVDMYGLRMTDIWDEVRDDPDNRVIARAPRDEVLENLASTGFPSSRITAVEGKVEDSLPQHAPDRIAVLRLDTDWYESTRHELECLYPRLTPGGILIVDDYGYFEGARQAVDEYFARSGAPLLNRLDYTGRLAVKPGA